MVAVSTVFWRLKLDWILLLTLGAAVGGGPVKKTKIPTLVNNTKSIFFVKSLENTASGN